MVFGFPPHQVERVKAGGVGASPRIASLHKAKKAKLWTVELAVLQATLARSERPLTSFLISLSVVRRSPRSLQNFGMQGGKGGDFLSGFLKKYYPNLAWRKALWLLEES